MCSVCLTVSVPAECGLTSAATLATREAAELFINCGTDGNLEKLLIFSPQEFLEKTHKFSLCK